jgi:hypothetical protein
VIGELGLTRNRVVDREPLHSVEPGPEVASQWW